MYVCTHVRVCACMRVVSAALAQRVGVPNLSWRPSALSISHCFIWNSSLDITQPHFTHIHTATHLHLEFPPRLCKDRRRGRQWKDGRAPMHGRRLARMSWKKWSEIPDIKPRKKQQKEQRGWSQTPTEEPRLPALPYWLPSSPAFRPPLALFSSLLFDMLCLCPSLTQLNPVFCSCLLLALSSPLSSTPRPVPHTLQFFSPSPLKLSP